MATPMYRTQEAGSQPHEGPKTLMAGYLFGAPLGDLGWFASLIMGVATGMAAFFTATFLGIVTILLMNGMGHRTDYADSYRWVGLPVGVVVMVLALGYLGMLWVRRVSRKA